MRSRRFAQLGLVAALTLLAACSTTDPGATVVSGDPSADAEPIEQAADAQDADSSEDERSPEDGHATDEPHADEGSDAEHQASTRQRTDTEDDAPADGARTVEVEMDEFSFEPSSIEVSAGETVRFMFTNVGAIEHEAMLGDAHMQEEFQGAHDDHAGGHHGAVDAVTVSAGATGEMVVTFDEAGAQYFGCHLPGHYEAGMEAALTIS